MFVGSRTEHISATTRGIPASSPRTPATDAHKSRSSETDTARKFDFQGSRSRASGLASTENTSDNTGCSRQIVFKSSIRLSSNLLVIFEITNFSCHARVRCRYKADARSLGSQFHTFHIFSAYIDLNFPLAGQPQIRSVLTAYLIQRTVYYLCRCFQNLTQTCATFFVVAFETCFGALDLGHHVFSPLVAQTHYLSKGQGSLEQVFKRVTSTSISTSSCLDRS